MAAKRKRRPKTAQGSGGTARRPPKGRPFSPGQSGNPGGLPAWVKEVRELAGAHSLEALQRLVQLMRQKKQLKVAHAAACAILDRAGAKPIQPIAFTDGDGKPERRYDFSALTTEQKLQLEAALTAATTPKDESGEA